ncbi:DNA sulfur modification protein DndD [Vibrio chagasii]|nr:DNA sulfur modification protein DndD [Vibrio chagasii]CAH6897644.1 DNA sulfur modification protein DndD [Vibrio chagasii]CAH6902082.1 DNA sulfur modification protein DndD [Vibrio chagasii]CAH6949617.1 DNA sulfur modification protein DndD [Vibrio chagasii]CAH7139709.1 DNA sulfur modification protein DndD [Vibrio chagasii]
MKLIKLEIYNFRQFYGKQAIDFSVEPNRGVTLIHGENNGGKTALLNALRWCLYEETTDNLLDPKKLLNKHAEAEGSNIFSVFLQLEHDNRLLEVRRVQSKSNSKSDLKVFEIIDGCYSDKQEDSPNTLINTFLPKEMSQYFFYQGEGTGTLSSQNDFSHIKSAIDKVLGLTVANKTVSHLEKIKTDYQRDLRQFDTSNEIDTHISNKETLQELMSREENELEQKRVALSSAQATYEEQVAKFAKFDKTAIEEKIKLRDQKTRMKHDFERKLIQLQGYKAKETLQFSGDTFSAKLALFDPNTINTEELNKSLRYSVDKQLLQEVLHNQECICGTSVSSNSQAMALIEELGKHAVDPDLKRRWQQVITLHKSLSGLNSPKQRMQDILDQIDDCEDSLLALNKDINELSLTIVESDIDDVKQIENAKNRAWSDIEAINRRIPILENNIRTRKIDIDSLDVKISKASSSQPRAEKIRNLIHATQEIIKLYEEAISSSQKGVDVVLLTKMRSLFSQVAFNGYTVKKDTTGAKNNSFTWAIVDKEGKRVAAGNGYQAMLSISFIVALIEFSKERASDKQHLLTPGTVAPFIADSILAFIGPDNGRELVSYIADKVEQAIFMFSQAQWTESHTDKGIRNRVGKEYNLVQHTVLTEDEFKGSYPTKLSVQGKSYDVVRFASDFDKVTIEEVSVNG